MLVNFRVGVRVRNVDAVMIMIITKAADTAKVMAMEMDTERRFIQSRRRATTTSSAVTTNRRHHHHHHQIGVSKHGKPLKPSYLNIHPTI